MLGDQEKFLLFAGWCILMGVLLIAGWADRTHEYRMRMLDKGCVQSQ